MTNGGLLNNYEYGILIQNKSFIEKVRSDFKLIANSEITGLVKHKHLNIASKILKETPKIIQPKLKEITLDTPEMKSDILNDLDVATIAKSLKGWKLEIFRSIDILDKQIFSLEEVYKYEDKLKLVYPNNKNIKTKIRQQIQFLRDIGLVEFLSNGTYLKLWI